MPELPPDQSFRRPSVEFPSWLASVAVHGLLLLFFASSLKSCGGTMSGEVDGRFRKVGIHLKQSEENTPQKPKPQKTEKPRQSSAHSGRQLEMEDNPPVELDTPAAEAPPILGPSSQSAAPSTVPNDVGEMVQPNAIRRPSSAAGLGQGETSFFDIKDKGQQFVYVLDSSGSMTNHAAIQVAKAELKASLEHLDQKQRFQIIFYNQTPHVMSLRGKKDGGLYWGTDVNRTLARQFIRSIRADLGTDHLPALKKGLQLKPDVLFFLTDADEPRLTARDLNEVKTLNGGATRIHCIQFGKGAELSGDNFLKKLARQNGGSYRYRDVRRFQRR